MKTTKLTESLIGKKALQTTALVSLCLTAGAVEASANERLRLQLGGYMEQWIGVSNQDELPGQDYSGAHMVSDSEVHFRGTTTLGSGLTVGAMIQLEGSTDIDQIDESYLFLKGAFGELVLGSENTAMYKMHYAPDEYGIGISSGDQSLWVSMLHDQAGSIALPDASLRRPYNSVHLEPMGIDDAVNLSYYTPRVEGIQFGVSWAPDMNQGDSTTAPNRALEPTDFVTAGVNFIRKFGPVGVKASVGYGLVTNVVEGEDEPSAFTAGLGFEYGGFGIGGSYAESEYDGPDSGTSWLAGLSYEGGPWGVSVNYFNGEREGTPTRTGAGTAADPYKTELDGQAEQETVMLSAKYTAGPGIAFAGTLGHSKFTSEDKALRGLPNAEVEGAYLVIGPKISF